MRHVMTMKFSLTNMTNFVSIYFFALVDVGCQITFALYDLLNLHLFIA